MIGTDDGAPTPLDGVLMQTELELVLMGVGAALFAKNLRAMKV